MPNVIRVGDPTDHGGAVLSSSASMFTVEGIAVACVGDPCSCPIPGHAGCTIAAGEPHFMVNGKQVAFDGHKTTCGASLIATVSNFQDS